MKKEPESNMTNRDPKAGCAIMIIIALIVGLLITFSIYTPIKQSGMMSEFTESSASTLETKNTLEEPPPFLTEKLRHYNTLITNEDPEPFSLSFSKAELNAAIKSYGEFEELQGALAIKEITSQEIVCDISFQLRSHPFSDDEVFLNGTMYATPEILNDEIVLNVSKIDSSVGTVPEGFLGHLQPYRLMAKYSEHDTIGRIMFGAQEIQLSPDKLTITVDRTKYADPSAVADKTAEKMKQKKKHTTNILVSFLFVGGLFIFMVKRRNKKSADALRKG